MQPAKAFCTLLLLLSLANAQLPNKIYSVWHCGVDSCMWATSPPLSDFQWILNNGNGKPSANVVTLAFVNPLDLLQQTNGNGVTNGVPSGMTTEVVNYFTSAGITVLVSIGGANYVTEWNEALANPQQLAQNAANMAKQLNVGIEIDYEDDGYSYLNSLSEFVTAYRNIIPNDGNGAPSILTVDLGSGTGYLTGISQAASQWLSNNQVNYANAMVSSAPWGSLSAASQFWQQHLTGASWANIGPMPPNQLVVSLYADDGSTYCDSYTQGDMLGQTIGWVNQQGSRGISFWAVGCPMSPYNCDMQCNGIAQGSVPFLYN
eukprot:TRINITY_DN10262_c0_g1_i1.p1 TRINITY_DN10262_c0_g1~~TRINITY_DN10262_c0_g1_i1.p1  ORF type:complete len:318 (-),score=45.23 TRINITY_DN10262_c0_g1_i1:45-998(-)